VAQCRWRQDIVQLLLQPEARLKRFPAEMNRDDKVQTVIRLILRRAQAHALSRDAIIA